MLQFIILLFFRRCHILDLPWEDVLVPHILCHLPLRHIASLQRVSKQFQALIQVYLANCRNFDLSQVSNAVTSNCPCGETVSVQFATLNRVLS